MAWVSGTPSPWDVSSYVTLRTYSEVTRRWEMVGLSALQPAVPAQWHGEFKDGSFRWESRVSRDDGKTWVTSAVLLASRKRPGRVP